ncbi:hypothetical protein B0H10DRAFT_881106 [Mycena sp. CBHHK59/15]|nr:hypothetical protein B0H10DRAFT_881106 [Mycena sp. CBHHK59/15]
MGRWTQYDEDSYRLPEGMVRTGYDADTGRYTFQDRIGTYEGLPGSKYGLVYPVSTSAPQRSLVDRRLPSVEQPSEAEQESSTRLKKAMRRATLPSMPDALRSLKRSFSTARKPWRRDRSAQNHDKVAVSPPSSTTLRSAETSSAVAVRYASNLGSLSLPSPAKSKTPRGPDVFTSKSAALSASSPATSKTRRSTDVASSKSVDVTSPSPSTTSKPHRASTVVHRGTKSAISPSTNALRSPSTTSPSRSASTSASRRAASESAALQRADLERTPTDTTAKSKTLSPPPNSTRSTAPSPASVGAAFASTQNVPLARRQSSTQTSVAPSRPDSPRPTRAASPSRPRTSRQSTRAPTSLEAPSTSRTMAMALAT